MEITAGIRNRKYTAYYSFPYYPLPNFEISSPRFRQFILSSSSAPPMPRVSAAARRARRAFSYSSFPALPPRENGNCLFFFFPFLGVLILLFAGGGRGRKQCAKKIHWARERRGGQGKNKDENTPGKKPGRKIYFFLPLPNYFILRYVHNLFS